MNQDRLNALHSEVTAITNQYASGLITVIEFLNAMVTLRTAIGDDVILDGLTDLSTGLAYPTTAEIAAIDAQHSPKPQFTEDWRETKPGLHMLYVKWGVTHLQAIDKCVKKLSAFSNGNLNDAICALAKERHKLVTTNAAYADADELLERALHPKRAAQRDLEEAQPKDAVDHGHLF